MSNITLGSYVVTLLLPRDPRLRWGNIPCIVVSPADTVYTSTLCPGENQVVLRPLVARPDAYLFSEFYWEKNALREITEEEAEQLQIQRLLSQ